MSKRRKTSQGIRYQVPSLQSLALAAVRKRGSKTYSHSHSNLRQSIFGRMSDSEMGGTSSTTGTQTRSAAQKGAEQVGQGMQVVVPRAIPHGFNDQYTVRLSYADSFNMTIAGAGGGEEYLFRTNSIYDPDYTGIGHQPLMRDLWASQYDYYTVLACHYHIEIYNGATDHISWTSVGTNSQRVGGVVVTLLPTTNATDIANMGSGAPYPGAEMKHSQTQALWPENFITFKGTLTPGDFIVDAKDADSDTTWTAVGSNPAIPRFLGFAINSVNSGAFAGASKTIYTNCQIVVRLDYDVQFTQLNQTLRIAVS